MARRLVIAAVALLALVIGLHLTRDTARGQGVGSLVAICTANDYNGGAVFGVDGAGNIYAGHCWGAPQPFSQIGRIPPGHTPTSMTATSNGSIAFVGCADGDVYQFSYAAGNIGFTADLCGNMFGGGPTPALRENWGSLKARYR